MNFLNAASESQRRKRRNITRIKKGHAAEDFALDAWRNSKQAYTCNVKATNSFIFWFQFLYYSETFAISKGRNMFYFSYKGKHNRKCLKKYIYSRVAEYRCVTSCSLFLRVNKIITDVSLSSVLFSKLRVNINFQFVAYLHLLKLKSKAGNIIYSHILVRIF